MLTESFLANLLLFVAGQAAAWFYLRTGRLWLGGVAMATLWVAADWAVMARYVFADEGAQYRGALTVMQIAAVATVVALVWARARRRWSTTARRRGEIFEASLAAYLRGALDDARHGFRLLVRTDPWDAAAWLALGNVHRRRQETRAARRCYRRCRRVDLAGEYGDLAAGMLLRLDGRAAAERRPDGEGTGAADGAGHESDGIAIVSGE